MFFYIIIIVFIISIRIWCASSICSIFGRSMESNAFEKSRKMITDGSCFCITPSIIRWVAVDLFSLKAFWLSRSMFSSTGLILWNSSLLYILAADGVKLIPLLLVARRKSPFFGKGMMQLCPHISTGFWF